MSEKLKIQFTKDEIIYLIQDEIKAVQLTCYDNWIERREKEVEVNTLKNLLNTLTKPFDY